MFDEVALVAETHLVGDLGPAQGGLVEQALRLPDPHLLDDLQHGAAGVLLDKV